MSRQCPRVEWVVRSAEPADDLEVERLFGALHAFNARLEPRFALADDWPKVLRDHLAHVRTADHGVVLLAEAEARPVGLAMMEGHSDSPLFRHRSWAELVALYVEPEARGCGVADRLLEAGLVWARTHGYDRTQLYVTVHNTAARRFYARAGFHPIQEIWATNLSSVTGLPPEDEACEPIYARGHHLLSPTHHALNVED